MRKAYSKDIWRAIWKGKKRFFSIMLITTLGVGMLTGLKAACEDLRYSADEFLDEQNLYDICVVSTLGLTDADVEALAGVKGVEAAEGSYSETVHIRFGEKEQSVSVKTLSESGMNRPYLMEGRFPEKPDEIDVTGKFIEDTGCVIGDRIILEEELDTDDDVKENEDDGQVQGEDVDAEDESGNDFDVEVEFEEEETPNFLYTEYTITGVVTDPLDINNSQGAVAFRSSSTEEHTLFVLPEAVDSDIYTQVYLIIEGGRELFCYSDEYEDRVAEVVDAIECQIKEQREQARYEEITDEAYGKLADARQEAEDGFAEAEEELANAREEIADGWEELADGERELADANREAEEGFADARVQLADGYVALADGSAQLDAAESELGTGEQELYAAKNALTQKETEVYAQIEAARTKLTESQSQTTAAKNDAEGQVQVVAGMLGALWPESEWAAYVQAAENAYLPVAGAQVAGEDTTAVEAAVPGAVAEQERAYLVALTQAIDTAKTGIDGQEAMLDPAAPEYDAQLAELEVAKQQLDALPAQMPQLALGLGRLRATEQVLAESLNTLLTQEETAKQQFEEARKQLEDAEGQITYGKQQIADGRAELAGGRQELLDKEAELEEKERETAEQIADAKAELADGRQELLDGEQELADGEAEYQEKKTEVEQKLADAQEEIEDIDMTQWYVQDRTSLSGYANVESDAASIESIGTVFPIVFFIVAILISLTTITRMVEEDRGLIGTYKALGFTDREIRRKYLIYAFAASLFGSVLGDICGFIVLPEIIFVIFDTMYLLPTYMLQFNVFYGIGGALLFIGGIVGATAIACKAELLQTPAVLMRPKAPRSGSRVFLEYITPVWSRLSFLNKVTARNLFRYKKRLFMTVAGIMGCMALLLFGFAVKDSVTDLMPRQYEQVYQYDLMVVASAKDNGKLLSYVEEDANVSDFLNAQISSVKLKSATGDEETVQLIVVPEGEMLDAYIHLQDLDGRNLTLSDDAVIVTRNAADVLEFEAGDTVSIQDMNLKQREAQVSALVKNYLGNNIYMTQATYETLFGEYEPNGVLMNLSDACTDQIAYADDLGKKEGVVSTVSTQELREEFSAAFALINMVVYIVIIMAACLAFVVLFTLATTNISERCRELATIKVLGFFDREVHLYVNKETLILTTVGIIFGIPLGYAFAQTLTVVLNMPSIHLAVSLHTKSYLIAAGLSFGFALIVDTITDRSLDHIDPVEALKSVE